MQDEFKKIDVKQILRGKAPALSKKIPGFLLEYLTKTIHQDELNDILYRYADKDGVEFMLELIDYFNLTLTLKNTENIPNEGRFIFASNHPLGGLDGICLAAMLGKRFDGKIRYLVNDLLLNLPNLRSIFVPINKHGAQAKQNALLLNEAYASDNQIITFPAGLCSRKVKGKVQDLDWKKSFIQKSIQYQRDVIPVYFKGENSGFFYNLAKFRKLAGVKMNFEMLYLPDEMFRAKGKEFSICFGKPISWKNFDKSRLPQEWAAYVREEVYNLKNK